MFVLNSWYAVGWSDEVGRELLPRTVCGRPIVLYRTLDGNPVALADACWHRLVPLSLGDLRDDDLMCGYHGIRFSPQGRCTFMPSQDTINPSASVSSFPVVDRYRLCWVWLGAPELADPSRIPAIMAPTTDPQWAGAGELLHLDCDYRLVLDNLMDLTHETYVHANSIGNDAVAESPFTVEHSEDTVTLTRWMYGITPPPAFVIELNMRFPGYDGGPVDRWQIIRWQAPSTIVIDVGVALAGTGADKGNFSQAVRGSVVNTVTPETDKSNHYFWLRLRDHSLDDAAFTETHRKLVSSIFEQDRRMLNAQQIAIDAHPGYDFYNLNIDAGGMWVRRILERQAKAETGSLVSAGTTSG